MSVEEAVQRAINFNASDIGPVANAFYADRSEVAAIMGPIGSGKTSVSLMKPLAIACEQQPNGSGIRYYKHIVLRDTYRNLYNTVIPSCLCGRRRLLRWLWLYLSLRAEGSSLSSKGMSAADSRYAATGRNRILRKRKARRRWAGC